MACLTLYQNKHDKAIGITHISQRQRGLIWYYNYLQHELNQALIVKSFYLGVIREGRKKAKQIKQKITPDTSLEEAQKLYQEYLALQDTINSAIEAING